MKSISVSLASGLSPHRFNDASASGCPILRAFRLRLRPCLVVGMCPFPKHSIGLPVRTARGGGARGGQTLGRQSGLAVRSRLGFAGLSLIPPLLWFPRTGSPQVLPSHSHRSPSHSPRESPEWWLRTYPRPRDQWRQPPGWPVGALVALKPPSNIPCQTTGRGP